MRNLRIPVLLSVILVVSVNMFSQFSGVMPWFNEGNNYGEVQDSVYHRDPIFAFELDPESSITIDGIQDAAWDLYPALSIGRVFYDVGQGYDPAPVTKDFSAKTKLTWDEDNLYLWIEVMDDTIVESELPTRQGEDRRDLVEISWGTHFPYNPDRMGTDIGGLGHWAWNAGDGDRAYTINCGSDSIYDLRTGFVQVANQTEGEYASNIDFAYLNHDSIYIYEIKLPWSDALGLEEPVVPGDAFSFDIATEDLDTEGNERQHKMALNSLRNNLYAWRFYSGKLILLTVESQPQNNEIVTIVPLNTTGQEEITITLDPSIACSPDWDSANLVGVPQIGMHSSAVLRGEPDVAWYHAVWWDEAGVDGTEPILMPNGDGTYSITLNPSEFYGTGDAPVKGLSMVFNNSRDWTQSARAFGEDGCVDLYATLSDIGINSNALLLDGADDYMALDNVVDDMIGNNSEYTYECWIKPESPGILFGMNYGTGDGDNNYLYNWSNLFSIWAAPNWYGTIPLEPSRWYHFAVTMDAGDNGRFYVNGMEVRSFEDNHRAVPGARFSLGQEYDWDYPTEHLGAIVDDVMIWKKARSGEEIRSDLQRETTPTDPDLLAWYTFEEINSNAVIDNSSYNNLGILNGNPRLVPSYGSIFGSPPQPFDLRGFPSQSSVALSWASNNWLPGELYNIYLGEEYQGTSVANHFRVIGLEPQIEYDIYVAAVNGLTGEESERSQMTISTLSLTPVLPALTAPVIDGEVDPIWNTLSTTNILDKIAMGEAVSEEDLSNSFRTMWDQDALYFLFEVKDDSIVWDLPYLGWDLDGQEIYLDMGNEKVSWGYDTNDVQLRFIYNHPDIQQFYMGQPPWVDAASVDFAHFRTSDGFNLEIRFPWAALEVDDPHEGMEIGVEITGNDNDGGFRESILAWNAITDDAWKNPSVWGTVVLLTEDTTLNLFFNKYDSHADLPEGQAKVTVQGGAQPYSYLWSTGDTLDAIRNLYPGTYSVTVTDSEGSTKTGSVIIQDLGYYYANCSFGYEEIVVTVMTDDFGGEISWDLLVNDTVLHFIPYETYGNNTLYTTNVCVPVEEEIIFTIRDYGGDGICCANGSGYFRVESSCAVLVSGDEYSSFKSGDFTLSGIEHQAEFSFVAGQPGLEEGIKGIQTCEGQFAVIGHTDSKGAGKRDIWLIKMDGGGDTLWTATFGTPETENAVDILQSPDGGFLLLGERVSGTDRNAFLIKTDADGDKVWEKAFTHTAMFTPLNVQSFGEGYLLLAQDPGTDVATVLQVDLDGDSLWSMTDAAYPRYLETTEDGGFAILYTGGTTDSDVKIRKFDQARVFEWMSVIADTANQVGHFLQETFENDFVVSGESYSDGAESLLYLLKTDQNGNKIWSGTYGPGTAPAHTETHSLEYLVAANRDDGGALLKVDPNGNKIWEKAFGKLDAEYRLSSVTLTADNGYVAAGKATDQTLIPDIWVFRTNQDGYGCFARPLKEKICFVTIDRNSEKNMVVWEKTEDVGTGFYKIYRETTVAGVYEAIGLNTRGQYSQFVDMGSDPQKQAYRYKMSVIDTCGNESGLSDFHQPIFLQVSRNPSGGHNLDWSLYQVDKGSLNFKTHLIYGGTDSTGLELIDSVSGNVDKYTDQRIIPRKTRYYYRVRGVLFDACDPTGDTKKAGTGPYNHSLSNMDDNKLKESVNHAPTDISLSRDNVDESLPPGTLVAILTTVDQDTLDMHTYSLVAGSGDDNNSDFSIQGDSLLTGSIFYTTESEHDLSIRIMSEDDGVGASLSYVKEFTIHVNDVTGIRSHAYGALSIYPNPMLKNTTISFSNQGNDEYELFLRDVSGKLVHTVSRITSGEVILERGDLRPGYYSVEVRGPSTFRGRLLVR